VKLPQEFYERPAAEVAVDLLGRRLVCVSQADGVIRAGIIVETEAYVGPEDLASHASRGRTARSEVMFGPAGIAYVYLIYGMHHCFNAVTGPEGFPAAVLVRALEPETGTEVRTNGPGLVCRALQIDRSYNGADLTGKPLFVESGDRPVGVPLPVRPVHFGPRVGVGYAGDWAHRPLRFWLADSKWFSKARRTSHGG
jgi:DNA-3-methyladenine glycosylase